MTDYASDPNYPSIQATPIKHPWLHAASNALRGVKEIGNKAEIPDWMPLIGGEGVGDLMLGNSDREIGKWAMGSSPFSENREGLGSKIPMITDARKKDVADAVGLGLDLAPMGGALAKASIGAPVGLSTKNVGAPLRAGFERMMAEKGIPSDPSLYTPANKSALKKLNDAYDNNKGLTSRERLRGGGDIIEDAHVLDERPIVNPEDLLGKYGVQVQGDRTAAGKTLHQVNGVPLDEPVNLQGGAEYARVHDAHGTGAAWASMKGAAANKQKQFQMVADKTGDAPLGVYSAMSRDDGANFSHHVAEAMVRQLRALDLPKKVLKEVDQQVRTGGTGAKAVGRPDFVGLQSPDLINQIMGREGFPMDGAGEVRKALVAALRMPGFQDKGVPHFGDTIKAVTDPALYHVNNADSGYTIFKSRPDQELMKNIGGSGSHSSYDTMIPGEYMGGFERQIPGGVMFPKTYQKHAAQGRNAQQTQRSMFLNQQDYEHFDQEWLDGVMNYLRGKQ